MEITEKEFWENYWGNIELPKVIDMGFKNDRVVANSMLNNLPKSENYSLNALEIGCAPGRWMEFVYRKLNYRIDGFEYLETASKKTSENLLLCNVPQKHFKVVTEDFLVVEPNEKYDLVMSFGFIEHFDNYKEIFEKHLKYTKKDGYTVVGMPNFRGLNYYVQLLIDKISGSKMIENHNIDMMDKNKMLQMIKETGQELIYIDYIGGFEFALFNMNDIKNPLMRISVKLMNKFFSYIFYSTKKRYLASYMIFITKNSKGNY